MDSLTFSRRAQRLRLALLFLLLATLGTSSTVAGLLERGDLVYTDGVLKTLMRWRPGNDEPTILADLPVVNLTGVVAVDTAGGMYVMQSTTGFDPVARFFRFDEATRKFTSLSSERLLKTAYRIAVSADNSSLLVTGEDQAFLRGLYRVDLATGKQSLITTNFFSKFMDLVPATERPYFIQHTPEGRLMILDNAYAHVVEFDESGGGRKQLAELAYPFSPTGLAIGPAGEIYVAGLNAPDKVVRVDRATGKAMGISKGGLITAPADVTVALDGTLLVSDVTADAIFALNPITGEEWLVVAGVPSARSMTVFAGTGAAAPALSARGSGNGITISWPDGGGAWQLQRTASLSPPVQWSLVTELPALVGGQWSLEVPVVLGRQQWFRLVGP